MIIQDIEDSIRRLTAVVRQDLAFEVHRSFGEDPNAEIKPLGWWVLACGEKLKANTVMGRDVSRNQLLEDVRMAGLVLPENIWIWDESDQAQLVISTVPTLKRAEYLAKHLRRKGLEIRIRREKL
ncbi:hypothetical protein [Pseudodesulfovibrio piezophilus]|uniref:Uncharacterized protein n=1 Tax=Pseudodesulfovibrio piezophilus (strain DSM 21447 / JCM 15486 / C1TLV30) TaxID=1322246 RepID=M1WPW8_PSEP2|nr:hypothetical protein [Pseudodesulfovibrio piezophilus]CCH48634.1 conserved protein of unknown function [Pseudodesulfovibrio piezophilus C1TLV30]